MTSVSLSITDTLRMIPAARWNALVGDQPLLSHAFLHALHETGCAAPESGWAPRYLIATRGGELVGAMPLYLKAHSYGEYVFDWSWADAYRRHGRRYYPKLLAAIPFTPATGPRLIARDATVRSQLLEGARAFMDDEGLSSLHILFPQDNEAEQCAAAGFLIRNSVQFHWSNNGYRDFADFLSTMNHGKRAKIRQERRKLAEHGVEFERLTGAEIGDAQWRFFFRCYSNTYREHHSTPYLSLEFFTRIGREMPDNILMVIGSRAGKPVCAALDAYCQHTLWGRYWGTTEYVRGLHFEACYYQALEFCIERGIGLFEGGAQGAHKLARGFLPIATQSAHLIADTDFSAAIARFVAHEREDVAQTVNELERASPFRNGAGGESTAGAVLDSSPLSDSR